MSVYIGAQIYGDLPIWACTKVCGFAASGGYHMSHSTKEALKVTDLYMAYSACFFPVQRTTDTMGFLR